MLIFTDVCGLGNIGKNQSLNWLIKNMNKKGFSVETLYLKYHLVGTQ